MRRTLRHCSSTTSTTSSPLRRRSSSLAARKYGAPQSNPGIDPAACTAVLPGVAGFNGGGRYDAQSCGALTAIPDTYTGNFDGLGSFTQPNNIAMNMQLSYDVSPRVQLVGTLANIFNTCWGGTHRTLDVRQR